MRDQGVLYEINGYSYFQEEEREEDNCKIFHNVRCPDGKLISMDWSPYSTPSSADFELWLKLDRPRRITNGPLNRDDLNKIAVERSKDANTDLDQELRRMV